MLKYISRDFSNLITHGFANLLVVTWAT